MRRIVVSIVLMGWLNTCLAQYFQFSQYNFTPQRINPSEVSKSDYATLSFDYRNQATDGGFHLTSNILNVSYPLFSRSGQRWAGIGLSFMDDRSGQAGIFNTQEVGLSYAVNLPVARNQTLSLGVKGLYQNRKIDLDGLYTGSQYVPDRGFSEAIASGENTGQFAADYVTFSAGLYWQELDDDGSRKSYWGVSFFDFNKPENSFFGLDSRLNSTFVISAGFQVYQRGSLRITPEVLYTRSASNNIVNAGFVTRYDLKPYRKNESSYLNVITKYVVGRSGIIGLQLYKENFAVGISYDFPVFVTNVANTGAVEVGVELRKLVVAKKKNGKKKPVKKKKKKKTSATNVRPQSVKKPASDKPATGEKLSTASVPSDTTVLKPSVKESVVAQKLDSIKTSGNAEMGKIKHEPLVVEKATLDFNFEFNSADVNQNTATYLDDLAKALIDNPQLKVQLVGHTDNIGSEKFNLKLSFSRAQTIKDYLIRKGIKSERISVDGKGKMEPLNDNSTPEKRALNRRVELTILYAD